MPRTMTYHYSVCSDCGHLVPDGSLCPDFLKTSPSEGASPIMSTTEITFACYPSNFDNAFESFLLDVPTLDGNFEKAARRAYFACMARLAGMGFDVDDFNVCAWKDNAPGPLIGPDGIVRSIRGIMAASGFPDEAEDKD
jgi:hypothetical protein